MNYEALIKRHDYFGWICIIAGSFDEAYQMCKDRILGEGGQLMALRESEIKEFYLSDSVIEGEYAMLQQRKGSNGPEPTSN